MLQSRFCSSSSIVNTRLNRRFCTGTAASPVLRHWKRLNAMGFAGRTGRKELMQRLWRRRRVRNKTASVWLYPIVRRRWPMRASGFELQANKLAHPPYREDAKSMLRSNDECLAS
jgi:hypothetical protein